MHIRNDFFKKKKEPSIGSWFVIIVITVLSTSFLAINNLVAQTVPTFKGNNTSWHGFDRYDFLMDEVSFAITPIKANDEEGTGVKEPEQGKRRCIVVVPKNAAPGNPWSWRGCYWDHQPQTEVELLKKDFTLLLLLPYSASIGMLGIIFLQKNIICLGNLFSSE